MPGLSRQYSHVVEACNQHNPVMYITVYAHKLSTSTFLDVMVVASRS